uniref:Uncharacterized protein n=1 Tax=Romanomermis culicivorax TaxID=13658 RepID=A0A915IN76_ROMCU
MYGQRVILMQIGISRTSFCVSHNHKHPSHRRAHAHVRFKMMKTKRTFQFSKRLSTGQIEGVVQLSEVRAEDNSDSSHNRSLSKTDEDNDDFDKHSYPRPLSSVECLSNTFNCPVGYSCHYGQCWPVDSGRACVIDGECSQRFYKCIYGRCQAFQDDGRTECTSTQQCPKYHMCRLGQCWPSTIKDYTCTCDYSCPNSHIYRPCSRNSDCPSDHICNNKTCYPREQNLCRCSYNGQCNDSHLYE